MALYRPEGPRASIDKSNVTVQDVAEQLVPVAERAMEYDRTANIVHLKAAAGCLVSMRRVMDKLEKRILEEIAEREKAIRRAAQQ